MISVGTNSCRLLVAARESGERWRCEYEEVRGTRLGQGLGSGVSLAPEAVERTLAAVREFAPLAGKTDARFGIATSALRDADGSREFARRFRAAAGFDVHILTGAQEASCSFAGALAGLRAAGESTAGTTCVVDVGGGSTEFAVGTDAGQPRHLASLPVGAVRITERLLASDPPTSQELELAAAHVRIELEAAAALGRAAQRIVAVGGTADTAARMLLAYDASDNPVAAVQRADLEALLKLAASLPLAERKRLRALPEQRADIFPAGLVILVGALAALGADRTLVTRSDLLLGFVLGRFP